MLYSGANCIYINPCPQKFLVYAASASPTHFFASPFAAAASASSCVWQARSRAMKNAAAGTNSKVSLIRSGKFDKNEKVVQ